jgi:transcriptional regulator ATRX
MMAICKTALVIVPANTLANWINEVEKWTAELEKPLTVFNFGGLLPGFRPKEIEKWKRRGGLLLMGDVTFLKESDYIIRKAQPDVLVLDEAHTMLKCAKTQIFKKLEQIKTKRRILLTGTPLQNNVTEYFHMVEFIRPGVFGVKSVKEFEEIYR